MSPRRCTAGCQTDAASQRGAALVWALFFIALVTGILVSHSLEMTANRQTMDTRYRRVDLAKNIAESGLTEATAYLRRQSTQPVLSFAPQLAPEADPPRNETLEPDLGLVREFEVQGSLWGRYEIRKDRAIDVSANYGEPAGTAWDVEARGYLFQRADAQKRFDQKPNSVISVQTVRTELRGLPVQVPGNAAVVVLDPTKLTMLTGSSISADGKPGVGYRKPEATSLAASTATEEHESRGSSEREEHSRREEALARNADKVAGMPKSVALEDLSLEVQDVFRLRTEQVRNLSDVVLANPKQIYGKVVKDLAVFSPSGLVLSADGSALRGRMLLFVDGDFIAQSGNNSDFSGVLYVNGDAAIEGPFQFHGTMVVTGTLKVGGTSDMVSIVNDQASVTTLRDALSRYRLSKDLRPPATDGAFAAPGDLSASTVTQAR